MPEEIIREYTVGAFRGDFPDVDIAPGVDMEALRELDADPFFATLPIVPEVGAVSGNGLLYDEELVSSIERQINENRPGGIFGHLKDEERDTSFPLPSGLWVGAKRIANTLWGKVYCPPGSGREHIRTLKALGGEISTSIYGKATKFEKVRDGVKRAINFKLESLDFAPPARAALGYGAVPHVTREMTSEEEQAMATVEVINELRKVTPPPKQGWQPSNAEQVSELVAIREMLGVDESADLPRLIGEMRQVIEQQRQAAVTARISELVQEGVKLASARGVVRDLVNARRPQTVEEAESAFAAVLEMASIQELLALTVRELSGPSAIVNGRVREMGQRPALEDTPENRQQAVAAMGINI